MKLVNYPHCVCLSLESSLGKRSKSTFFLQEYFLTFHLFSNKPKFYSEPSPIKVPFRGFLIHLVMAIDI